MGGTVPACQTDERRLTIQEMYVVLTCGSRWAVALVGIDQVNAAPSVLTGVAVALLDLDITDGACVSSMALTGEGGDAIFTQTMVARLWYTVVDVFLTERTSEAWGMTFLLRKIKSYASDNFLGQIGINVKQSTFPLS